MLSENEYTPNDEVFTLYMRRYARNHIPAPQLPHPPQQPAGPSIPPNPRVSGANQEDNKDDESSDSDEPPSY